MDREMLTDFRHILEERLNEMLPVAAGLRASLDYDHDLREAMDEVDLTSKRSMLDIASALHSRTQTVILEIMAALKRMENGNYGVCQECGEDIGSERLKVQPTTVLCVHCRRRLEVKRVRKVA